MNQEAPGSPPGRDRRSTTLEGKRIRPKALTSPTEPGNSESPSEGGDAGPLQGPNALRDALIGLNAGVLHQAAELLAGGQLGGTVLKSVTTSIATAHAALERLGVLQSTGSVVPVMEIEILDQHQEAEMREQIERELAEAHSGSMEHDDGEDGEPGDPSEPLPELVDSAGLRQRLMQAGAQHGAAFIRTLCAAHGLPIRREQAAMIDAITVLANADPAQNMSVTRQLALLVPETPE